MYFKLATMIEEPWLCLCLKGISQLILGALVGLPGTNAKGLSTDLYSYLKQIWKNEYGEWRDLKLPKFQYVYISAEGFSCNVRLDHKPPLQVYINSNSAGRKPVKGLTDAKVNWLEFKEAFKAGLYDGNRGHLRFAERQRCWVQKSTNILNTVREAI